uniref:Uncharacterized protein n=1 Tax=Schlesneria paludicola TaxID=360056 RepID=A0A7C4LNG7_9PLAN
MAQRRIAPGIRRACAACALWLTILPVAAVAAEAATGAPSGGESVLVAADDLELDPKLYRSLTVVRPGVSTAAVRKQAVSELTLAELPAEARRKAERVLQNMGLFRRLPTLRFEVEPRVFHHLLQHPDVAVSTWRAMEISRFELKQTAPNIYQADAKDGSAGQIEVWRSTDDDTLIYCDGAFKSPLLARPVVARSIMRLRTRLVEHAGGPTQAECVGDVFVEFPSQTVETIAKLISPISHSIADRNFKQLSLYAHLMSQAMTRQPDWVAALTERMDASDAQKAAFLQLARDVHQSARQRTVRGQEPMPVDTLIAPLRLPLTEGEPIVPAGYPARPR